MRFARLGPAGHEIPTVHAEGRHLDLRPVLADLGGDLGPAFFAGGGIERAAAALAAGELPAVQDAPLRVGAR